MILDKLKKLRKPAKKQGFLTQEALCQLLDSTLRSLNCEVEWTDDDDSRVVHYKYQDGCFFIEVHKSQPAVRLCFPSFFSDSLEELDLVRQACNHINVQTWGTRLVYTSDADHYQVFVHCLNDMILNPDQAKEMLTAAMLDMFVNRTNFYTYLESTKQERDNAIGSTSELDKAQERRLQVMLNEHEVWFGSGVSPLRETSNPRITLALFVAKTFQLEHIIPSRLDIMGDDINQSIDASQNQAVRKQLSDYLLASALVSDGVFARRYVTLRLIFFTADQPYERRYLTLTLVAGDTTKSALYFQVSAILPPLLPSLTHAERSSRGETKSVTMLMAYDLKDEKSVKEEFLYLWKDAKDKLLANQVDQLSKAQRLIVNLTDASLALNVYQGKQLFLSQRYLEALPLLTRGFEMWRETYENMGASDRRRFGALCFMIGYCYDALEQYRQGYYYLSLVDMEDNYDYVREMVSCLVSMNDPRAAGYIDSCINFVCKSVANETGYEVDEYAATQFSAFHDLECSLLVARVGLLIDHHHFKEAEEQLQRMSAIDDLQEHVKVLRAAMMVEKAIDEEQDELPTPTSPSA